MPILFECPGCQAAYEIDDNLAGQTVVCQKCDRPGEAVRPAAQTVVVVCPSCRQRAEVEAPALGHWVRCPSCQTLMRARAEDLTRPTRRRVLMGAGGLLAGLMVGGLFLARRRKTADQPARGGSRRSREPGGGPEGQPPDRPGRTRGRGGKRRPPNP